MDAKQFAEEIVTPTIDEFEKEPRSRRGAFLACVATFYLIDYIGKQRLKDFRRECPAFVAVERYAHALKHTKTGHRNSLVQPLAAEQIVDRPPGFLGKMVLGLSRLGDTTGGVTVAGEPERDLLDDVKKAATFLRTKL